MTLQYRHQQIKREILITAVQISLRLSRKEKGNDDHALFALTGAAGCKEKF
jgi:hypothetical protein